MVLTVVSKRTLIGKKISEFHWSYFPDFDSVHRSCKLWLKILFFDIKRSVSFSTTLIKYLVFWRTLCITFLHGENFAFCFTFKILRTSCVPCCVLTGSYMMRILAVKELRTVPDLTCLTIADNWTPSRHVFIQTRKILVYLLSNFA